MDLKKLDLNLLVTLEALLAERNVTKAAQRLGLSQPAVSAQLARLRDLFGDQLLVPAQRGMIPTTRASTIEPALADALARARGVVTHGVTFDPDREELAVAIAAADVVQYSLLVPFAVWLRKRAPGIRLSLRGFDVPLMAHQVESGEIDLAITLAELAPEALISRKLQHRRYMLIARREHPVVRQSVNLEQFLSLEHLLVEPGRVSSPILSDSVALGGARNVVLSVSNFLIAADIVASTDLVAIVPLDVVCHRTGELQIVEPPIHIPGYTLVLVWHQRTHTHAGHRWLRQALIDRTVPRQDFPDILS